VSAPVEPLEPTEPLPERRRFLIGAAGEIVAPDDRLLLIEQERNDRTDWLGPGGALEPNESLADGARREALEETGLRVRVERLIRVGEFWDYGEFVGVVFVFLARPDPWPQEVRLAEIDGRTRLRSYRWATRAEVAAFGELWHYHIARTAWPTEIEVPRVDRLDFPPG
jgi:8-oxo-dGTP diphosphatase